MDDQKVMQDNMEAFTKVSRRKLRWVTYRCQDYQIVIDKTGDSKSNFLEFSAALPKNEPRYCVYDHEYQADQGRMTSKVYFIFWTPTNSSQIDKVTYSQALQDFRAKFTGTLNKDLSSDNDLKTLLGNEYTKAGFTIPQVDSEEEIESEPDFD